MCHSSPGTATQRNSFFKALTMFTVMDYVALAVFTLVEVFSILYKREERNALISPTPGKIVKEKRIFCYCCKHEENILSWQ